MENEVLYDSLSFDNRIISEKLGMYDYAPSNNARDINMSLKLAMLQKEVEKNKAIAERNRMIAEQLHEKSRGTSRENSDRESHYNQQPSNNQANQSESPIPALTNTQFLLLVVFIAVAVCVIQYVSYRSSMSEMMQIINNFVRSVPIVSNVGLSQANQMQTNANPTFTKEDQAILDRAVQP
jgi:hypothetical protein